MAMRNNEKGTGEPMKMVLMIAALEREIAPLVKGWHADTITSARGRVTIYQKDAVIVAVGGIGTIRARAAADAAYHHAGGDVGMLVSVGLAGALAPEWNIADIFEPATVIDDADGIGIETAAGAGTLITAGTVADAGVKQLLAAKHIAQAVDMEAYAVADVARIHGVRFRAIKAISDESDFAMPPLGKFIAEDGGFRTASFAFYAALRPWLWSSVARLAANSAKASGALCTYLAAWIESFRHSAHYNGVTNRP
jgi:adenosylhomocysteine nucleosidase